MVNLFLILFLITAVTTVVFLFKPALTQFYHRPALSRKTIGIGGTVLSLICLFIVGTLAPPAPKPVADEIKPKAEKADKTQAEIDKEAEEYRQKIKAQQQALADEDQPQVEIPAVDYTSPVAKVDIHNDAEIVAAVGLPVVEKEKGSNQNGEPMTTYYFSQDLSNGLELSLSREYVDVAWKYNDKDQVKTNAVFESGQQITRALLGGKEGAALYESISTGGKVDFLSLDDGMEIKNARCGASMCRYQVSR
ncbi:hypothetical protein [Acinetobacter sp.]|uniref:hypothetical protein n=1 Tax=Acinetobacter sp. TaxID=472 RepID=UPI0024882CB5|nr:hypothetical protein [Acinetobacter sp.]MDI1225009.1 hypothetical protein [Acinetobacter sp.]